MIFINYFSYNYVIFQINYHTRFQINACNIGLVFPFTRERYRNISNWLYALNNTACCRQLREEFQLTKDMRERGRLIRCRVATIKNAFKSLA